MGKVRPIDWETLDDVDDNLLKIDFLIRVSGDREKICIWRTAIRHFKKYRRQHGLFCAIACAINCAPATARRKWDGIAVWLTPKLLQNA